MRTSRSLAVLAVVLAGVACSDNLSAPVTTWVANISVVNETPAPTGSSTLAGSGSVTLSGGGTGVGTLTYTVTLTGAPTAAISAMHIHGGTATAGAAGTTAGVRVNLCGASTIATDNRAATSATWAVCGAGAQTVAGTVTWASGSTLVGGTGLTFDGMVSALRAYNMYINVHTGSAGPPVVGNPGGEARGQLLAPPLP
jgi:CHRD domain-containing protein